MWILRGILYGILGKIINIISYFYKYNDSFIFRSKGRVDHKNSVQLQSNVNTIIRYRTFDHLKNVSVSVLKCKSSTTENLQ